MSPIQRTLRRLLIVHTLIGGALFVASCGSAPETSSGTDNGPGGAATSGNPGSTTGGSLTTTTGPATTGGMGGNGAVTTGGMGGNGGAVTGGMGGHGGAATTVTTGATTGVTTGASAGATTGTSTGSSGSSGSGGPLDGGDGFYHMEALNRGVVAVQVNGGVYVGWRMLGFEYDAANPTKVSYNVYRNGAKVASVTNSTNYLDAGGSANAKYTVRVVVGGVEQADSEAASVWGQNYLQIPLQIPPGGTTPGAPTCETPNEAYTYNANDGSVGDVDGDGAYEIFLKWDPSNSKDNSQSGCTGNVYIDAYTLGGTRLWRIDLGRNIRAGAHYTQFIVYDFDGDGKAEMAVKTAPGTKDGTGQYLHTGPAANDDDAADYRSINNAAGRTGYVLSGPEYLTVFSGQTGAELATVAFDVPRGQVSAWGDNYGNRVDRFLATAGYFDNTGLPSFVMARGYYTRTTLTAWNWRNGQLSQLWKFDSNTTPNDGKGHNYFGQGSHSLSVANVDGDLGQEILYGAMAIDNNGKGLCSTGFDHGDALHVGDFIPSHPGLEVFMPNEDGLHPNWHLRDAATCAILQQGAVIAGQDTGRAVADDVSPTNPGAEMWAAGGTPLLAAATGANVGAAPSSINFLLWWDDDESRELENGTTISKYGGGTLLNCAQCASDNGTKSTPTLTADLLGDWREEIIWRASNNTSLRLYTTTAVTQRRIYTLMHDPQYRVAISWQNVAYNQPPHPSFHIGNGMVAPPQPNINTK